MKTTTTMKQIPNNRLNEIQAELEEYGYVLTDALLWHFEDIHAIRERICLKHISDQEALNDLRKILSHWRTMDRISEAIYNTIEDRITGDDEDSDLHI